MSDEEFRSRKAENRGSGCADKEIETRKYGKMQVVEEKPYPVCKRSRKERRRANEDPVDENDRALTDMRRK